MLSIIVQNVWEHDVNQAQKLRDAHTVTGLDLKARHVDHSLCVLHVDIVKGLECTLNTNVQSVKEKAQQYRGRKLQFQYQQVL